MAEFVQQKESAARAEHGVLQLVTLLKMLRKVEWPRKEWSSLSGSDGDIAWQSRGVRLVALAWVWLLQGQMLTEGLSSQSEGCCSAHLD